MQLKLVLPSKKYLLSYQNYVKDFIKNGELETREQYKKQLESSKKPKFITWLSWDRLGKNLEKGMVQQTTYWAVVKEEVVGRISFRHKLTKALRLHGGHVGYAVRPSKQKKGYATEMLRLLLPKIQKMGYKKVLLTCDFDNTASRRTIEKNKGKLESVGPDLYGRKSCFYWIDL